MGSNWWWCWWCSPKHGYLGNPKITFWLRLSQLWLSLRFLLAKTPQKVELLIWANFSSFLLCIYENCQKCHKRVKCNYIFSNIVATQTTRILESEIEKNKKKRWHRKCYIYLKRKSHLFFTISGPHKRAHKKFYIFRSTFPNLLVPKLLFYSCCGDLVKFYDCDLAHLDDGVDCS